MTLTDSIVSDNQIKHFGYGGGIENIGTFTVTDSIITGNSAGPGGGGGIWNAGSLTVANSQVNGNSSNLGGAGILQQDGSLTVTYSLFSGNDCGIDEGGGIYVITGLLTVTNSNFSGNLGEGAGLATYENAAISVTVTNSTFYGNRSPGSGGAVLADQGTLAITNCTFNDNQANNPNGGGLGGAVYLQGNASLTVTNSTVSGNRANDGGGGYFIQTAGTLTLLNTIIAGNAAPSSPDVGGLVHSLGHNLIGDCTGGSGFAATDQVGTAAAPIDPKLGPLQDNGGLTPTMALLAGSPAINAGTATGAPATDQRGALRLPDPNIDSGAYESGGPYTSYVNLLYFDLLGRPADQAGLAGWASSLAAGTLSYYQVAWDVWHSGEQYQRAVGQFYQTYLHRAGNPQEVAAWVGVLESGALSETDVALLFVTSPEYNASHPTNQSYVEGLYNDLLNRNGAYTPAEVAVWTTPLDQGTLSRPMVAADFLNSTEALSDGFTFNYTNWLNRQESLVELQGWLAAIAPNALNGATVATLFLSCPEYLTLAGAA